MMMTVCDACYEGVQGARNIPCDYKIYFFNQLVTAVILEDIKQDLKVNK